MFKRFALFAIPLAVLTACSPPQPPQESASAPWECIAAKVTIGTNTIDTVVRYNKFSGEAQLLNAASFASKATGAQGNIIGWVPLGDLKNAVQELMQREQAAQQQGVSAAPSAPPQEPAPVEPAPDTKKRK